MTDKTIDHRLAWLAGIIDGEGWIGFTTRIKNRTRVRTGKNARYEYACWYVAIANTDPAMLCEVASIADAIAARYCYQLADRQRGNRKEQQRITFGAKADVRLVLEAVFPYLVNKRPHAELTLRALHHRYGNNVSKLLFRNAGGLPVRLDAEFHNMARDIRRLNQRGLATKEA